MAKFTVCINYRDMIEQVEHELVSSSKMVQLVRSINDTFVESYEVHDSEGEVLSESEVWEIVDAETWADVQSCAWYISDLI